MRDYLVSKYLKDSAGEVLGKVDVDWLKLKVSVIIYNEEDFVELIKRLQIGDVNM